MYCIHCGNEIADDAVVCVHCGRWVEAQKAVPVKVEKGDGRGLRIAVFILMIVACVINAVYSAINGVTLAPDEQLRGTIAFLFAVLPLTWCVPMTVIYFIKFRNKEKVGTAFKVCTLIFVSMISGILMFCDNND